MSRTFEEVFGHAGTARRGEVAAPRRAVTPGDLAHATLPAFRRRVTTALEIIAEAAAMGALGVAFSGGKDSTVTLDLVRLVVPEVAVALFDSGCEYPWTYDLAEDVGAELVHPRRPVLDMYRAGGYFGRAATEDPDLTFDFLRELVQEPAARWQRERGIAVTAMGLRAQESKVRQIVAQRRGTLYQVAGGMWHLCPLAWWTESDVWAYIGSRALRYNQAYDRMAAAGIARRAQRVSTLIGSTGAPQDGRMVCLRRIWPEGWSVLAAEFPKIVRYT